jgi:hypothetical protein
MPAKRFMNKLMVVEVKDEVVRVTEDNGILTIRPET